MSTSSHLTEFRDFTPADILDHLSIHGEVSPLMAAVLQTMEAKLSEVRANYFRKPVASMPFGVTPDDAMKIARLHPELREISYEPNEAISDAVYQGCRHLAVRRCLKQLLQTEDSAIAADPYAHQILLDGVYPYEHEFVFRYHVPLRDISREDCDEGSNHFVVADLTRSQRSVTELIDYSRFANAAELLLIAPYDPDMWSYFGGQCLSGSYVYEWMPPGKVSEQDLTTPMRLPSNFFTDKIYRTWSVFVQPYGATEATVYTRSEFLRMFAGAGVENRYVETRLTRNGFAEVSMINFSDSGSSTDLSRVSAQEAKRAVPVGTVEVHRLPTDDVRKLLTPGRQYDLAYDKPIYVRQSYYEKALQQFFKLRIGRDTISAMMRHLHANSAHLVYNGAIVTAELMVDVEAMCVVLESVVTRHSRAKHAVTELGARARVSMEVTPREYVTNILKYAALRVVQSTDVSQGLSDVGRFIRNDGRVTELEPGESAVIPPLDYGDPTTELDAQKDEHSLSIREFAEDALYGGPDIPYTLDRADLPVDRSKIFEARMLLKKFGAPKVSLVEVQSIYDTLFPGNSMIDPTSKQLMSELGDAKFIIDAQYFRASIPMMFSTLEGYQVIPSKLRTSIGADLMHSFRNMMASLMKRNFNRPRPEAPGSRRQFIADSVTKSLSRYARTDHRMLLSRYNYDSINVSDHVVDMWAAKHPNEDVLSAATMLDASGGVLDPSVYRLMPKDVPKPPLSLEPQGQIHVGQTIVFHSKDLISITCGIFTLVISRLLALFNTNIRFAFGADEHRSGVWADDYLHGGYYVTEIDIPKFDKTQDWTCFELVLFVMETMGVHPDLVKFWRKATDRSTVFDSLFHLVFITMFGNRSGSSATLATNCIVLLFAFLDSFDDAGIVAMLIKGDDNVLVTRRPLSERHEQYLYERWGFSMKQVGKRGAIGFCSGVFVKDTDGNFQLVRDVVRVIEKFGRALPVNKPASYFLDYYVSVLDTAIMYQDPVIVQNLTVALHSMYGTTFDVPTLCDYVRHISQSTRVFLRELYGLSDSQIEGLNKVDEAVEMMTRLRNSRFVKGKGLVDVYNELRLPFVDRVMIMSDWIYQA